MICKFERHSFVEAVRFEDTKESFDEIRAWVGDRFYYDYQNAPRVFLSDAPVNKGYWIVKENNKFVVRSDADMSYFTKITTDREAIFKKVDE